jgi:hypothetical protein
VRLNFLHESSPLKFDSLPGSYTSLFKKGADTGRSGEEAKRQLPSRSGNQNTAIEKPRHRKFFNTPRGSIESGTAEEPPVASNERPKPVDEVGDELDRED